MKALIYHAFGSPPSVEDVEDPHPARDGVVVKTLASGICRSDWHGWMGHDTDIHLPHIPGHELVGEIVAKGKDVRSFDIGDRVTVPFVLGCGSCEQCTDGNPQVCDQQFQPGFTAWGSFAELVALKYADQNLVRVPEIMDNLSAASLGCRFITAFRAVIDQGRLKAGEWVAVHGCGGVGLSAVMIAHAAGARVVAIDINAGAMQMASDLGSSKTVDATKENVVEAINEITKGGVHLSVDALGSRQTAVNSLLSLRKHGRHVQVGLMAGRDSDPPLPVHRIISHELHMIGSHGMQAFRYPYLFSMIEAGRLDPSKLVSSTVNLEQAPEVLMSMNEFKHSGITVIDQF